MTHINLSSKLYQEKAGAASRKERWALGRLQTRGCAEILAHLTRGTGDLL